MQLVLRWITLMPRKQMRWMYFKPKIMYEHNVFLINTSWHALLSCVICYWQDLLFSCCCYIISYFSLTKLQTNAFQRLFWVFRNFKGIVHPKNVKLNTIAFTHPFVSYEFRRLIISCWSNMDCFYGTFVLFLKLKKLQSADKSRINFKKRI